MTTRTRQPKTRTCRVEDGHLIITVDGVESRYELHRYGDSKVRLVGAGTSQVYDVDLARRTCDCPAGQYGKTCKHTESLTRLVTLGRI